MKTVLVGMKNDEITDTARNDPLIIQLGNGHARRCFGMDPQKRRHYVSHEMRNVARLLINIRSLHPSDDEAQLETFISPKYFDTVVEAVHLTAGQIAQKSISHASDDLEHRPSVALKIGHSLGKLAAVKRCQALRQDDSKRENDAEN